jgi:ATP-dependent Clp protease adapter protein ClpS
MARAVAGRHETMRMLWFGRFSPRFTPKRDPLCVERTPRTRPDDEIALALSTLPMYCVILTLSPRDREAVATRAGSLTRMVGEERAARILADAGRAGAALVAVCPRELAEHYRDELERHALPCVVEPA